MRYATSEECPCCQDGCEGATGAKHHALMVTVFLSGVALGRAMAIPQVPEAGVLCQKHAVLASDAVAFMIAEVTK